MVTSDGYSIPNACFDASLIETMSGLCDEQNSYLAQVPDGYIPSFIDLRGDYSQMQLDQDNFQALITSALQRMGRTGKGKFNRDSRIKIINAVYIGYP